MKTYIKFLLCASYCAQCLKYAFYIILTIHIQNFSRWSSNYYEETETLDT